MDAIFEFPVLLLSIALGKIKQQPTRLRQRATLIMYRSSQLDPGVVSRAVLKQALFELAEEDLWKLTSECTANKDFGMAKDVAVTLQILKIVKEDPLNDELFDAVLDYEAGEKQPSIPKDIDILFDKIFKDALQ